MADHVEVTRLLQEFSGGNRAALDELVPAVYCELRRLAQRYLRQERPGHTLQPTALVNEVYLKLVDQDQVSWQNRAHFFGVAAQMMRHLLIDHAKAKATVKRGGGAAKTLLDENIAAVNAPAGDLLAIDQALTQLATLDPQQAKVVELRVFGGLTVEETAEVLGISAPTVKRDWRTAKTWLYRELTGEMESGHKRPRDAHVTKEKPGV
jgi:RNA polymerase sigma factor (TIGR02999 family)